MVDENWRGLQVHFLRKMAWPRQDGIVDMIKRLPSGRNPCEGMRLRWCIDTINTVVAGRHGKIEHKVGLAYDVKLRFEMYQEDGEDGKWTPNYLVLIERPTNREAAGYLESALIMHIACDPDLQDDSMNARRKDLGGEGPRQTKAKPHYIYFAVRVLVIH